MSNMQMLLDFNTINAGYDVLNMFDYNVVADEITQKEALPERWKKLLFNSKKRDIELQKTKEKFAEITKVNAEEFGDGAADVKTEFVKNGPDVPKISLEDGLQRMKDYQEKMDKVGQDRGRLVNAQKLFNIP